MKLRPGTYTPKTDEDWLALQLEIRSIFTPATPIRESDLFSGRLDQIDELSEACIEPGRHAVLYGDRGIGKTSLANIFHRRIRALTRHIYATRVQCGPSDTFESLWARAFDELHVKSEDGSERIPLSKLRGTGIFPDDVRRMLDLFLPNELPIIIFDEFDKARDSEIRPLMANTIKNLSDFGSRATVIIVGVSDDVNALIGEHESIKRCVTQIRMPRMSNEELRGIIEKRTPLLQMNISNAAKWKIVILSRGLPNYAHYLGRHAALAATWDKTLGITEDHVGKAINAILAQMQESCREDYEKAIHSNQENIYKQVLLACAMVPTTDEMGYFAPSEVVEPLSQIIGKSMRIANFQNHLIKFTDAERGNILRRIGRPRSYKFRFADPMMQPFIILRGIADKMVNEKAEAILSGLDQPKLFPT
ncbi:MAG: AAA family ATPase [Rhodospirillales bacterium]|nr:AAA family ATPase [Rhodospirillales bacterium]